MLTFLVLALVANAPKDANAKEAERLARQSMVEYNVGEFDAALDDAAKAYKLDPVPGLLYNLGQCHRALHHWEKAEFFYRGYLREKPDAQNREAVLKLIDEMVQKQREAAGPPAPAVSAAPPAKVTVTQAAPVAAGAPVVPPLISAEGGKVSVEPEVEGRTTASTHSRTLSYTLMGAAAAGAVLAGISGGVMIDYQSYRGSLQAGGSTTAATTNGSYATFESKSNTAAVFNVLLYVGVGLIVGGLGGAVLTW